MGKMRAARLSRSKRLQRALRYMNDGEWHSTRDIVYGADVCAVNAVIPELEANGLKFERKQEGSVHYYKLVTPDAVAA